MKLATLIESLAQAERHVMEGEEQVNRQRERIRAMEEAGHDVIYERRILSQLESVLAADRADFERLRNLKAKNT